MLLILITNINLHLHPNSNYYCQLNVKCAFLKDKKNILLLHIYIYIYIYIYMGVFKYNKEGGRWLRLPYVYVGGAHEKKVGNHCFRETEIDSYFSAFERIAVALHWPREIWSQNVRRQRVLDLFVLRVRQLVLMSQELILDMTRLFLAGWFFLLDRREIKFPFAFSEILGRPNLLCLVVSYRLLGIRIVVLMCWFKGLN